MKKSIFLLLATPALLALSSSFLEAQNMCPRASSSVSLRSPGSPGTGMGRTPGIPVRPGVPTRVSRPDPRIPIPRLTPPRRQANPKPTAPARPAKPRPAPVPEFSDVVEGIPTASESGALDKYDFGQTELALKERDGGSTLFDQLDSNQDGVIERNEWPKRGSSNRETPETVGREQGEPGAENDSGGGGGSDSPGNSEGGEGAGGGGGSGSGSGGADGNPDTTSDEDRTLTFAEFKKTSLGKSIYQKGGSEALTEAFRKIDRNQDQLISLAEWKETAPLVARNL
ncbi:MAG: hypothetical protein HKN23_08440 [Verrucomicrobiales bacterium]|nr:hypothetical protein [Verrucomicrobiales bacterium]